MARLTASSRRTLDPAVGHRLLPRRSTPGLVADGLDASRAALLLVSTINVIATAAASSTGVNLPSIVAPGAKIMQPSMAAPIRWPSIRRSAARSTARRRTPLARDNRCGRLLRRPRQGDLGSRRNPHQRRAELPPHRLMSDFEGDLRILQEAAKSSSNATSSRHGGPALRSAVNSD